MLSEMKEYRDVWYEYEMEKKFPTAYFYKQDEPDEFELITVMRYGGEPTDERLRKTIDEEIFDEW